MRSVRLAVTEHRVPMVTSRDLQCTLRLNSWKAQYEERAGSLFNQVMPKAGEICIEIARILSYSGNRSGPCAGHVQFGV